MAPNQRKLFPAVSKIEGMFGRLFMSHMGRCYIVVNAGFCSTTNFWPAAAAAAAVQDDHTLHEFTMRCTRMFTQQHICVHTSSPEAHRMTLLIAGSGFKCLISGFCFHQLPWFRKSVSNSKVATLSAYFLCLNSKLAPSVYSGDSQRHRQQRKDQLCQR